jgi:hypothetical protein
MQARRLERLNVDRTRQRPRRKLELRVVVCACHSLTINLYSMRRGPK